MGLNSGRRLVSAFSSDLGKLPYFLFLSSEPSFFRVKSLRGLSLLMMTAAVSHPPFLFQAAPSFSIGTFYGVSVFALLLREVPA